MEPRCPQGGGGFEVAAPVGLDGDGIGTGDVQDDVLGGLILPNGTAGTYPSRCDDEIAQRIGADPAVRYADVDVQSVTSAFGLPFPLIASPLGNRLERVRVENDIDDRGGV